MATAQPGGTIHWPWPPWQSPSTDLSVARYCFSHSTDTAVHFWLFLIDFTHCVPPTCQYDWGSLSVNVVCHGDLQQSQIVWPVLFVATRNNISSHHTMPRVQIENVKRYPTNHIVLYSSLITMTWLCLIIQQEIGGELWSLYSCWDGGCYYLCRTLHTSRRIKYIGWWRIDHIKKKSASACIGNGSRQDWMRVRSFQMYNFEGLKYVLRVYGLRFSIIDIECES